jgi:hypothetical protein
VGVVLGDVRLAQAHKGRSCIEGKLRLGEREDGEFARLLRPGGRLVFLTNSVLATLCVPEEEGFAQQQLLRPQRRLNRVQWPGGGVEFHPSHGEWIRMLVANGFVVDALHELYAPADAKTHEYYAIATAEWARQWPVEDLWAAHLTNDPRRERSAGRQTRSASRRRPAG